MDNLSGGVATVLPIGRHHRAERWVVCKGARAQCPPAFDHSRRVSSGDPRTLRLAHGAEGRARKASPALRRAVIGCAAMRIVLNAGTMAQMSLVALGASALTLTGRELFTSPLATPVVEPVGVNVWPGGADELREALARIEAALDGPRLVDSAPQRLAIGSTGGEDEDADRLEDVLDRLDRMEYIVASGGRDPARTPLDRGLPVDMGSIRAFIELAESDGRAAERDLHLSTPSQVIARFGYPDRAGAANGGVYDMWWGYERVRADGELGTPLQVYFTGDLVLGFSAQWRE